MGEMNGGRSAGSASRRGWVRLVPAVILGLALQARAEPRAPDWLALPFAQKLDMHVVREVTRADPGQLLATMARLGVDLQLVRSTAPGERLNPLLSSLPMATPELVRQAEFRDTYEGRVVLRGAACCGLARDTILIRDTARTYTLLHEFVQSQLLPTDGAPDNGDVELQFAVDFRRLVVYQRYLDNDPLRLLDPLWRRDIVTAQVAVANRLFRRIQMGQSQEAIVEKVLCCIVGERSLYFEEARQAEGLRFGEAMINNAVDVFNAVHGSVSFVEEAVRALRDEVRAGRIQPAPGQALTDEDVAFVEAGARSIGETLARVRDEIAQLKQFYTRADPLPRG